MDVGLDALHEARSGGGDREDVGGVRPSRSPGDDSARRTNHEDRVHRQLRAGHRRSSCEPDADVDALGLPLEHAAGGDYIYSEAIGGSKHFGVWPLTQAAQACFGKPDWPENTPRPQACIEFELADVDAVHSAAIELRAAGFQLLHDAREEPWGQTVARMLSPEQLIIGLSHAPWLHP